MRWFIYKSDTNPRHLFVQAKNASSAKNRLSRWSKVRKVDVSDANVVNKGIGYETMSQASMTFPTFILIDRSF